MASSSLQLNLPPALLKRVENEDAPDLNKVENGELPLELAQKLAGELVTAVLNETQLPMKALGDKGAVGRWTTGKENPNLARLIQRTDARKVMAKRLLDSCDDIERIEEWRVVPKRRSV